MTTTDTRRRNRILCFVVGFTIGIAGIVGSAAQAEAKPIKESTIKSECKDAGGTYHTGVGGITGIRFSSCNYAGADGVMYADYYENGEYTHTKP